MRQSGLSLVELLVSVTILALATTVALVVYDQARLAYKQGENVAEQQQVVRVAFDIVSSDVRMAGFNTNPDGNRVRPDEQIEAAYATAITVRADFDADDPVDADLPEQSLGGSGSAFLAVSTGNDEIVSYVLAKADGSSTDTLTFSADVGNTVRDATIEDVSIGTVDLAQTDPPYTLYRLVLENDSAGCCGTSFARRIPIVDNVRSLRFRYYDRAGNEIVAPGGDETAGAIATRSEIRRVGVEIEALTRDSDPHWLDPDDANADTRMFRKFRLSGEITPPNLGRAAIPDLQADATPPGPPGSPWLYPGHCEGLFVDWPANPPQDEVAYYRVAYGTNPAALDGLRSSTLPGLYVGGLDDGVTYRVTVEAVDASGNRSSASSLAQATTTNSNTPEAATDLQAVGSQGQVDLNWTETAANVQSTAGDPASPMIRDLSGYRVYRGTSSGFVPSGANRIADETSVANLPAPEFVDATVAACRPHYYRVRAVDACGVEGQDSNEASAQSWTDVDPLAPLDVQAFASGASQVTVIWSPVQEDVDGNPVYVDTYKIYRSPEQPFNIDDPSSWSYLDQVVDATEYVDPVVIPPGYTRHYLVQAVDRCSPPNESVLSDPASPACNFEGRVKVTDPHYGDSVWGDTVVGVVVLGSGPSAVNGNARLVFTNETTGATWSTSINSSGPSTWQYSWNAQPGAYPLNFFTVGPYLITAEVDQTIGASMCTAQGSVRVHLQD